jgi:D-alanine-D-alanine ligase
MYLTTNKPLSKQLMLLSGIETPAWQTAREVRREGLKIRAPIIIKPVWEDGSWGIDAESVFYSEGECVERIEQMDSTAPGKFFVEAFVEGREVSVSLLADRGKPEMLPPSEIVFTNFPAGKPHIVDYEAKWDSGSFAGGNTPRSFDFADGDLMLCGRVKALAGQCWSCFGLRGYARVDFRIDERNKPWAIDVNANPCVSPDSGFVAAATAAGYTYEGIITRIIDHAYLDSMSRGVTR